MKHLTLVVLAFSMLFSGAAFAQPFKNDNPINVGSKQFTEQIVLGKIIVEALKANGYDVVDRTNLGGTAVNRDALVAGEIGVYPEYTGTTIANFFRDIPWAMASIPDGASGNAYLSYGIVSSLDAVINDLVWLNPAPANNTYAFAVTRAFSEENNMTSAVDLAAYVNAGNPVMFATGDEFAQRPDGVPAFEKTYGFKFSEDQMIVIAGATPAQTEQALAQGSNGVNLAMAYGTDGALKAYDFVVLEDPDGAQPVFQPAPVFRGSIIRAYPEIAGILNPIFALFDNATLQDLNAQVEVDGLNADQVAQGFLKENGFID